MSKQIISTAKQLETYLKKLVSKAVGGYFSFDWETTGLNIATLEPVGLSITYRDKRTKKLVSSYTPVGHVEGINIPIKSATKHFTKLFKNKKLKGIAHNLKYDYNVSRKAFNDLEMVNAYYDTQTAWWMIDENSSHKLKDLAVHQLGIDPDNVFNWKDFGAKEGEGNLIPIEDLGDYAQDDTEYTYLLFEKSIQHITNNHAKYFWKVELPISIIVANMEWTGIPIDDGKRIDKLEECNEKADTLQQMIWSECGKEFNINSPQQLGKILFDELQLPILMKTPKGSPSTNKQVLQELSVDFDVPRLILDYRHYTKFASTFLKGLEPNSDGVVHASFNQNGTTSGRFSSSRPNMQNVPNPARDDIGIREIVVPFVGDALVVVDYSQIELCIMAHYSKDKTMLYAYKNGKDLHAKTGKIIKAERSTGKTANFGWVYGGGPGVLVILLQNYGIKLDFDTAKEYHERYKAHYKGLFDFIERVKLRVEKTGQLKTLCGRVKHCPDAMIDATTKFEHIKKGTALRSAINVLGQGGGADIIKIAMVKMDTVIKKLKLDADLILQVHDELVYTVPKKNVKRLMKEINKILPGVVKLRVPLSVSCNTGINWKEAK